MSCRVKVACTGRDHSISLFHRFVVVTAGRVFIRVVISGDFGCVRSGTGVASERMLCVRKRAIWGLVPSPTGPIQMLAIGLHAREDFPATSAAGVVGSSGGG